MFSSSKTSRSARLLFEGRSVQLLAAWALVIAGAAATGPLAKPRQGPAPLGLSSPATAPASSPLGALPARATRP